MTQYVNKSALVAEINERISYWKERKDNCLKNDILGVGTCDSRITELNDLLSSIDTLEVKEVDFEKIYQKGYNDAIKHCTIHS